MENWKISLRTILVSSLWYQFWPMWTWSLPSWFTISYASSSSPSSFLLSFLFSSLSLCFSRKLLNYSVLCKCQNTFSSLVLPPLKLVRGQFVCCNSCNNVKASMRSGFLSLPGQGCQGHHSIFSLPLLNTVTDWWLDFCSFRAENFPTPRRDSRLRKIPWSVSGDWSLWSVMSQGTQHLASGEQKWFLAVFGTNPVPLALPAGVEAVPPLLRSLRCYPLQGGLIHPL